MQHLDVIIRKPQICWKANLRCLSFLLVVCRVMIKTLIRATFNWRMEEFGCTVIGKLHRIKAFVATRLTQKAGSIKMYQMRTTLNTESNDDVFISPIENPFVSLFSFHRYQKILFLFPLEVCWDWKFIFLRLDMLCFFFVRVSRKIQESKAIEGASFSRNLRKRDHWTDLWQALSTNDCVNIMGGFFLLPLLSLSFSC